MNVEIKHRITGAVIFSVEAAGVKAALEIAVSHGADLYGADLGGADLRGAYLYGADLCGAYLYGADLYGADLCGAYLRGADLGGVDLRGADLIDADLCGAYLYGADLGGVDLCGAYLYGADLRGADLRGADLIDAGQNSRGYRFVGWLRNGVIQIRAGCRNFTLDEGREHWANRHDPALRAECLAKLDLIEAVAAARGWLESREAAA